MEHSRQSVCDNGEVLMLPKTKNDKSNTLK